MQRSLPAGFGGGFPDCLAVAAHASLRSIWILSTFVPAATPNRGNTISTGVLRSSRFRWNSSGVSLYCPFWPFQKEAVPTWSLLATFAQIKLPFLPYLALQSQQSRTALALPLALQSWSVSRSWASLPCIGLAEVNGSSPARSWEYRFHFKGSKSCSNLASRIPD